MDAEQYSAGSADGGGVSPSSTDELVIAICQIAPGRDKTANLDTVRRLAVRAHSQGARLVVFPEYTSFFAAPLGPDIVAAAEPLDGDFVSQLGVLAHELGIHLVAGFIEKLPGEERVSNTLVALDSDGSRVAVYRKQHLYDAFGVRESEWMLPGATGAPETFTIGAWCVGMQTCYDLRFPEVTRTLVDAGAELVLVPSEWVPGPLKVHHWRTLLTARAIENTVYVAAPDHAEPSGVGTSLILDPAGVVLAELGEHGEDVTLATLTRARLDEVRATNPSLTLRRYTTVPTATSESRASARA